MAASNPTLTKKQTLFCQEYTIDLNGKQAAIRAGYSVKTAEQQASRLLRNVKVQKMLDQSMREQSERLELRADAILAELMEIAFVKIEKDGVCKLNDKIRALELLGKHKKLFTDKVEQTVLQSEVEQITADMSPEKAAQIYAESMKKGRVN
jgi:phage terminase small subunit